MAHARHAPDGRRAWRKAAPRCRPSGAAGRAAPEGFEMVTGKIKGGDRHGLVVSGRRLDLLPAARTLGAGLATQLFGAATSTTVTVPCWTRPAAGPDKRRRPDPDSRLPGRDLVAWTGPGDAGIGQEPARASCSPTVTDVADWGHKAPQVTEVTRRWCERVLDPAARCRRNDAGPGYWHSSGYSVVRRRMVHLRF